jgi:hypothetical protein
MSSSAYSGEFLEFWYSVFVQIKCNGKRSTKRDDRMCKASVPSGELAYDRRLRGDSYDSQRPSVRKCAGDQGQSARRGCSPGGLTLQSPVSECAGSILFTARLLSAGTIALNHSVRKNLPC